MEELISVIVPVYKVQDYLDACVASITGQTYQNLEIILVDDGSPDRCGQMCDEWAGRDARIKVLHQKNSGLSGARNAGLEVCRGAWVAFADSDDVLHPQMLETLYKALGADPDARIACCRFEKWEQPPKDWILASFVPVQPVRLSGAALWDFFYTNELNTQMVVAWNKLYSRQLFDRLRYPLGRIHEDEFLTYRLLYQAGRVLWVDQPLYGYRQRADSIMHTESSRALLDALDAFVQRSAFVCDHLPDFAVKDYEVFTGQIDRAEQLCAGDAGALAGVRRCGRQVFERVYPRLPGDQKRGGRFRYTLPALYHAYRRLKAGLRRLRHADGCESPDPRRYERFRQQLNAEASGRRFILVQTPEHGNLGDHAIAMAERRFLRRYFPDVPVAELPGFAFSCAAQAYRSLLDPRRDTILITGGGFAGSLWQQEEKNIQSVLRALKGFRIVMMPQTLYYEQENEAQARRSRRGYRAAGNLLFLAREKDTLERVRRLMPGLRCELFPDMVLFLRWEQPAGPRRGIGLCLRKDRESALDTPGRDRLAAQLRQALPDETFVWTDTVRPGKVPPELGDEAVHGKLEEFSSYRLIVTDRLHGMVFAALTGTPCIVLDNCDHKVRGVYDWLRQNPYVRYLETPDRAAQALRDILPMLGREQRFDPGDMDARFERLAQMLE